MAIIDYCGDSFIYGVDGTAGAGRVATPQPAVFSAALNNVHIVRNEGVSSNSTTKAIAGTDGVHAAWTTFMNGSNSDIVIIELMLNDSFDLTTAQYQANLTTLYNGAATATKPKKVIFQTCHKTQFTVDTYATAMRSLAVSLGIGCIDVYTWSLTAFTNPDITFYCPDGYHPNQSTYTMIGNYAASVFNTQLNATPGPNGQDASLWTNTFNDVFDGVTGTPNAQGLNTALWAPRRWDATDDSVKNYSVASNLLKIWPDATTFTPRYITTDKSIVSGGFNQKYGFYETRAQLPVGSGVVPVFTLLNHDDNTSTYLPEISTMEAFPGDSNYSGFWGDTSQHPIRYSGTVYPNNRNAAVALTGAIPDTFFGMHLASETLNPWPIVAFKTRRLWDSYPGISWLDINTSAGVYTWTALDNEVNGSIAKGITEIIYTFGYVPTWVNGSQTAPPDDASWTNFVTAIVNRYKTQIKYWQIWNEPNAVNFWTGTAAQMARLASLAAPIIRAAGCTVLSPSPQGSNAHLWLSDFLAAGGGQYCDVMTFHGYLMDAPEKIIPLYNNVVSVCAANGQSGKPIWDTEHSWFDAGAPFGSTTAQQSAWLARFVTLEASLGIARSVWYMWDNFTYGVLFDRIGLVILPPGIAWREVREWLVNAVVGSATVGANNLYTVSVTRADGTGGVIAWCGSAVVTDTVTYTIPAGCTSMRAIDGTYTSVTPGATITLGLSPVLLESQNVMTSAGGTDLSSAFHTYGVKWDATGMTFYLDGAAIGSSVPQTLHAPYDNLFLALGVKFGGKSGPAGGSTPTGNTNALQVSYVRAWQSVSTPTPPAPKLVIADRVQETSTSTGSGSMALQGAQMSYQPFLNVCNVGDTFYGSIIAVDSLGVPSGAWEVGQYTFAVGNSITRNTVYRSSNNNGLVSFGAGSKNIAIDIAATFAQTLLASGTTAPPTPPPTTTRPFIVNASGNQIDTSTLYGGVVFEDDFTSALDTTKWNTHHFNPDYAIKNYDTTTYTDTSTNPPTVRTVCRLWPARDAALDGGAGGLTPNGFFRRDLSTPGAFSMLYGYIEWNAKLLKGQGIFPAMWLFNDGTQQEIDNLECYGLADGLYADANYNITDFTTTCWHVGGGVGDYILNPKNADGTPKTKAREFINGGPPFNPPISGHWHKYGMHWDNSNLIFYFDGKPYLTVPHNGWYNNPMYLLFQLWFGSTAGSPTVANTPQGPTNAFELDWVRVWSLK